MSDTASTPAAGSNRPAERVAAIIPAHNEQETIAEVVGVARACRHVDEVIVVDNVSSDQTAQRAQEAGARVISSTTLGKGEAMAEGVAATGAGVILFLDADLLGLTVQHLDRLVGAVVEHDAAMSCGLFDRGPWLNPVFLKLLPVLTGERAVRRELFESLDPDQIQGYRIEAALNSRCADLGLRRVSFVCPGLWHLTKEKKFGNPVVGFAHKVAMLSTAMIQYVVYRFRHQPLRRPAPRDAGSSR